MASLFFSYSHRDEDLRDQLETQLAMLKRQGVIETWHDRRIVAGENLDHAIGAHVETDDVILLLVSPDFLASDYCYDVEMTRAMERHAADEAVVVPVILRPCDWHQAPFGKLMATPPDGRPVTLSADRDQAFLEVARAVRKAVETLGARGAVSTPAAVGEPAGQSVARRMNDTFQSAMAPRSSNLALSKRFTDRDRDAFLVEAFDYLANFFDNSVSELAQRNRGIEGAFRRVDANRFFVSAYRDGQSVARGTVFMGGTFGRGINYVQGETTDSNGYNESLSVEADDQSLYLRAMGMGHGNRGDEQKLTLEGAAEYYWEMFVSPLQHR